MVSCLGKFAYFTLKIIKSTGSLPVVLLIPTTMGKRETCCRVPLKSGRCAFDFYITPRNGLKTFARAEQKIRGPGNCNKKFIDF